MTRITISVPDDIAQRIAREAKRTGKSVSELIREALALQRVQRRRRLPIAGLGRSGTKRTARNADAVLADEGFGGSRRR